MKAILLKLIAFNDWRIANCDHADRWTEMSNNMTHIYIKFMLNQIHDWKLHTTIFDADNIYQFRFKEIFYIKRCSTGVLSYLKIWGLYVRTVFYTKLFCICFMYADKICQVMDDGLHFVRVIIFLFFTPHLLLHVCTQFAYMISRYKEEQ